MNTAFFANKWDTAAVMTARYTGEIPLEQVRAAFSNMELENVKISGSVRAVA